MATTPVQTDKSPEELLAQAGSFFFQALVALAIYAALIVALNLFDPVDMPKLAVTILVFVVSATVSFLLHMNGRRTEAPAIWIAGVVWLIMVMVYVLELPTGPGKCEHCTAIGKISLTLFTMSEGSDLMGGAGRLIGTWPALAMIGHSFGAAQAFKRRRQQS